MKTLWRHARLATMAGTAPWGWVERGAIIGAVGSTGRATGPHLHWAAQLRRARIDPGALLTLPVGD